MVAERKKKMLENIKKELDKASVIGMVDMHKLPARQLQKIKKDLTGKAKIIMARKSLLIRALKEVKKSGLDELAERVSSVPALIVSKQNPFKLYSYLKKNKTPAAAKAGDVAEEDIIVNKGPTSLQPGPAMTQLQSVGLKTGVEAGKVAIMQDFTVVKQGEAITPNMAAVFNMLGMEPMKIGIDIVCAWENGTIYDRSVLDIDEEQFLADIATAVQRGINLSINSGYLTKETTSLALQKAFSEARLLAIEANVLTADAIGNVLAKAAAEMKSLMNAVESKKEV